MAGEMLLPGSHKIRPIDIGVLLSGGILEVEVIKRPRVGLIYGTGDHRAGQRAGGGGYH
mgnify:CR=1 FL=1